MDGDARIPAGTEPLSTDGAAQAAAAALALHPDSPALAAAESFSRRRLPVPPWVGLLALLEDFAETWDGEGCAPKRHGDAVYSRDGWRCTAPGCTSRRNLQDHHLFYRSHGGPDDLSNRTTLCAYHHLRGEHGLWAKCEGEAPLRIHWQLGRRELGYRFENERRLGDATREFLGDVMWRLAWPPRPRPWANARPGARDGASEDAPEDGPGGPPQGAPPNAWAGAPAGGEANDGQAADRPRRGTR